MLTEDEARGKWCPMARVPYRNPPEWAHVVTGAINRGAGYERECRCIASACMAWQWRDNPFTHDGKPNTRRRGFCGLAGKDGA